MSHLNENSTESTKSISLIKSNILLYKIHYFLWFSSLSGVLPYYVVYVRTHTQASATWIGVLFSVLPFIAFATNPVFCSLADKSSQHLKYLTLFMTSTGFGYGFLLILPKIQSSLGSWLLSLVLLCIAYTSMATVTSLTDSIVMMTVTPLSQDRDDYTDTDGVTLNDGPARNNRPTFGQIRVWGTIGYGFFGFLSGPVNSTNFGQSYLELGFIMFIILLTLDLIIVIICKRKWSSVLQPGLTTTTGQQDCRNQRKEEIESNERFFSRNDETTTTSNFQMTPGRRNRHWSIFISLFINHPTIIQHTVMLIGQGILMACHWSYFYWFLESVAGPDTFLMGSTVLIGCFAGELTFFYYGNSIVDLIGPTNAFNVSLLAFTVQYICYAYLITPRNQYLVCFTEVLQGPTFGLFYTAMTHIGQTYADRYAVTLRSLSSLSSSNASQIHATLQGFLSGCVEGLGLGLGSLGAGLIIDQYNVKIMWIVAVILAVTMLTVNVILQFRTTLTRKFLNINTVT